MRYLRRHINQGQIVEELYMSVGEVIVSAFYKFISVPEERVDVVRGQLEQFAEDRGLKGLVVLGVEGINATVAGSADVIAAFERLLPELFSESGFIFKHSRSDNVPFARFKVDVRPEIVTIGDPSISSSESVGTYLTPQQWHQALSSDPDVVLVDTRNDYETDIGVFEGAIDPRIRKFSDFGKFVEESGLPKDKKLFLYCTGGIRCEKAVPEVKRLGYDNVYQLEGGILKYLEQFPEGHFKGECFVFDHRVAVDKRLQPTQTYKLCPHCGNPSRDHLACSLCGKDAPVCHRCAERQDLQTCSKNCAHHARLRAQRQTGTVEAEQIPPGKTAQ